MNLAVIFWGGLLGLDVLALAVMVFYKTALVIKSERKMVDRVMKMVISVFAFALSVCTVMMWVAWFNPSLVGDKVSGVELNKGCYFSTPRSQGPCGWLFGYE